ncbi:phosphonate ABC transporter, partial [Stutzerimonas stutzeri]
AALYANEQLEHTPASAPAPRVQLNIPRC